MFKHITRTVWIISLISLFNDISSEMLYPVIPLYLESIGYGSLLIGFLEGSAELLSGFSKIYTGSLSDTLKRRMPFVQLGYSLSVLSRPLMAVFQNALPIFCARVMDRVGKGIRTGARDAILAEESSENTRATVFGFHRSLDTLGAVLGPSLALLFLFFYPENYRTLILLTIVPGVVAIFFTFTIKEQKSDVKAKPFLFKNHFNYFKRANRKFKNLVLILFFFALASSSDMYLLLKAKTAGLDEKEIIFAYILFNLVFALAAFPIGKWADKMGKHKMLIYGLAVYACTYYLIGFHSSLFMITLGFILYGIYYACTDGIIKSLLVQYAGKNEKASAVGFYSGINGIVLFAANVITGWLWYSFNANVVFIGIIIITFISIILLFINYLKP